MSALERDVAELAAPAAVTDLLLALPTLYGRGDVLERAERLVKSARSEAALANLAEVYRLLRLYGLADSVLLDLGEVRGFDYYSGLHFEAYVAGLGASLAGGGRYDHMLGRFGYDCPATGFAFEVGRALLAMESRGVVAPVPRPDFFVIDFTRGQDAGARAGPPLPRPRRRGGARYHQPRARRLARLRAAAAGALGAGHRRGRRAIRTRCACSTSRRGASESRRSPASSRSRSDTSRSSEGAEHA